MLVIKNTLQFTQLDHVINEASLNKQARFISQNMIDKSDLDTRLALMST